MKEPQGSVDERAIKAVVSKEAKKELAKEGFDPVFGARPLKRLIQRKLYDTIALKLLKGEVKEKSSITIDYDKAGGKFVIA